MYHHWITNSEGYVVKQLRTFLSYRSVARGGVGVLSSSFYQIEPSSRAWKIRGKGRRGKRVCHRRDLSEPPLTKYSGEEPALIKINSRSEVKNNVAKSFLNDSMMQSCQREIFL